VRKTWAREVGVEAAAEEGVEADMEVRAEAEVDTAAVEADMVATILVVATILADTEAATTPAVDTAAVTIPDMDQVMTVDTTQVDMKEVVADIGVEVEDAVDLEATAAADTEEATLSLAPTEEVEEEEIPIALINLTKGRDINVFFSQLFFYQTFFGSYFI